MAAAKTSISAAAIAKVFAGIDFPKRKDGLKEYAKNISKAGIDDVDLNTLLDVINRLPDKEYDNMADIEKSIGSII
jgi:Protein of unknown function (DUF2795)